MWDLPGPGLGPVSPALAGGFLTTAPPGKPCKYIFKGGFCLKNLNDQGGLGIRNEQDILGSCPLSPREDAAKYIIR